MTPSDLNLFCISHKPIILPDINGFQLIQVGNDPETFAPFRDNNNDNIAQKNPFFSELTAMYYVWKNLKSPLIGFCHYRRYFLPSFLSQWAQNQAVKRHASGFIIPDSWFWDKLSETGVNYINSFISTLETTNLILPHAYPLPKGSFLKQYSLFHPIAPFLRMLSLIAEIDNQIGIKAHQFFTQYRHAYWNNLIITKWEIFDSYCQFLFYILFKLEKEIIMPDTNHQKRVFAFLSERLWNFWIWLNNISLQTSDWCILASSTLEDAPHQWKGEKLV